MKIIIDDNVLVIQGKDRGKRGRVIDTLPARDRLLVEGVNRIKRHMKQTSPERPGGIVERESPIHISNVMLVCPKCDKPTRVGKRVLDNGDKARVCKRCGEIVDRGK